MIATAIRSVVLPLLLLAGDAFAADTTGQQKPNIVFLLADDLGGDDLHCCSRTSNLDALAKDGTQFPATYPTYPANGGFANRVTITELLKKQGDP